MYIYIHIHIYICEYICIYTRIYIYFFIYICIYIQSYIHPSLYTCIHVCICTHLYICTCIQTPQTLPQNDLILKPCIRFFFSSASPPPHRLVQFRLPGHNHFVSRLKTSFYTASKQNPVERIFSPLKDFCSVWQENSKCESKENFSVWDDRISLCGRHFLSTHNWNFVSTQIFCFFLHTHFVSRSFSLACCLSLSLLASFSHATSKAACLSQCAEYSACECLSYSYGLHVYYSVVYTCVMVLCSVYVYALYHIHTVLHICVIQRIHNTVWHSSHSAKYSLYATQYICEIQYICNTVHRCNTVYV